MSAPDSVSAEQLEAERAAVRAASAGGAEIYASPVAAERALGWHLRRRVLRAVAALAAAFVLFVVLALVFGGHGHRRRVSAPSRSVAGGAQPALDAAQHPRQPQPADAER